LERGRGRLNSLNNRGLFKDSRGAETAEINGEIKARAIYTRREGDSQVHFLVAPYLD